MKIGEVADLLGRDQNELLADLKLEETVEEVSTEQVKALIDEIGKSKFSEGKTQGHDWGRKSALTEVEKTLSGKFGIKGKFDEIITGLETKMSEPSKKDDIWKEKYNELSNEFNGFKQQIEVSKKKDVVKSKLSGLLVNFDGTDKVKEMVVNDFLSKSKFEIEGDDIMLLDKDDKHLRIDGKFADFESVATNHLSQFLNPAANPSKPKPKVPSGGQPARTVDGIVDADSALRALRKAKTPEEREYINKKLAEYS